MRQTLCPRFCHYHKPGKQEEPGCGGLEWLLALGVSPQEVGRMALPHQSRLYGLDPGDPRLLRVCRQCAFLVDGCDFRDPETPQDCWPCGGLVVVAGLLAAGRKVGL